MKNFFSRKNILTSVLVAVLLLTIGAVNTSAETIDTIVKGTIKNSSNATVSGAAVTITCNGNVRNATSNSSGDYLVTYPTSECKQGDTVHGDATTSDGAGSNSAVVQHFVAGQGLELDIAILNITTVPEFGAITGMVAAFGSGIVYLGLKKKSFHL